MTKYSVESFFLSESSVFEWGSIKPRQSFYLCT